jgi:hypothetical protein
VIGGLGIKERISILYWFLILQLVNKLSAQKLNIVRKLKMHFSVSDLI